MRRLGGLDAAMLAAEKPANYSMHTMAVLVLDPAAMPAGDRLTVVREYVRSRIHLVPPLRRRLVETPLGLDVPRWVDDHQVDLDYHIRRVTLPSPGTAVDVAAFASKLAEHKLDRRYPLWEMHVVEGLAEGGFCIVAKVHHALMDGIVGMHFMASLFAFEADESPPPAPAPETAERPPAAPAILIGALASALRRPLLATRATGDTLRSGMRIAHRALGSDRGGGGRLTAPFSGPHTVFDAPITPRREVAFASLPMREVKRVAQAFGVTVNDVVLALVAGALRGFLDALGELPQRQLVAAVPVSVRGDQGTQTANLITIMLMGLATDRQEPGDRLAAIHQAALKAKSLQSALGPETLLEWLEVPVPALLSVATSIYSRLHLCALHPPLCNLVVSNVPGPPASLYFAGARLISLFPLGPIFDGVGLNITVVGGTETMDVGLVVCPDRLPDVWNLADAFGPSLDELDAARPSGSRAIQRTRRRAAPRSTRSRRPVGLSALAADPGWDL
ncbi:MAG: WS/DGAT/MGAT family O-acyltransferase [Acidimicrobiales bacterium]